MRYVDAHIHLSDEEYRDCANEIIDEAKAANVVALVSNSMNLETSVRTLQLAEQYHGLVYAALGIHPWNVDALTEEEIERTLILISENRQNKAIVAVGEIGLDHKYVSGWEKQKRIFSEMLHVAEKLGLPIIVHSRGTTAQILDALPSYNIKKVLLHWFSNPISAIATAVERGYCISEGLPTIYLHGIRDVVKKIPLANLLTETDGPVRFFREPFSGKRTTPAFIPSVVKAMADIKGMKVKDVAEQIVQNFGEFFGIEVDTNK